MIHVLIAEDDRIIREHYAALLAAEGFRVTSARDGQDALKKFDAEPPEAVLLDIEMPKMNGFAVCREIVHRGNPPPIIFLTANDSEANEVRAFGTGADDFVSKSDSPAVLIARLRRALERMNPAGGSADASIRLGDTAVYPGRLVIVRPDGQVEITRTQADILRLLASDRTRYFASGEIVTALRGKGYAVTDGLIHSHVYNLRRKLGAASRYLVNARDVGYRLAEEPSE